jgi:predicted DNA-binding transcriptional regulator AlpA
MPKKLLTARLVADRYCITDRTLYRWLECSILPTPVHINKRRYWDEDELDEFDKARAAKAVSA